MYGICRVAVPVIVAGLPRHKQLCAPDSSKLCYVVRTSLEMLTLMAQHRAGNTILGYNGSFAVRPIVRAISLSGAVDAIWMCSTRVLKIVLRPTFLITNRKQKLSMLAQPLRRVQTLPDKPPSLLFLTGL